MTFTRTIFVAVALFLCTGVPADEPATELSPEASLEASLSGDRENPVLTIRLSNTGEIPIVVDKELVFLPSITLVDDKGERIPFKHIRSVEQPEVAELESRLITLKPGEKIERRVELRKEFKQFQTAIGLAANPDDEPYHIYSAYESMYQMPEDAQPSAIVVSYEPQNYTFEDCFRSVYMLGVREVDRFYLGPLHARVPYRFAENTNGAPVRELSPEDVRNPIFLNGADPWIIRDGERFLWCFKYDEREIAVHTSDSPTQRGEKHVVWRSPETGPCSRQVWAPELHRIGDHWYIYFAASDGDNANHRAYVLKSRTADPLGEYELHGPLYTGDDFAGKTDNRWAIDMTVFQHADRLYAVWSGWEGTADVQHLFIAPMSDPCTISGPRVKMCANDDYLWERTEETPESRGLHEGAVILRNAGRTFLIYSCAASWLPTYKLGLLELTGDDPLAPASWKKHPEPVFQSTDRVFGVGHPSILITDEDSGSPQYWLIYHAKRERTPGWLRDVFLQPITFDATGFPLFGEPERSE